MTSLTHQIEAAVLAWSSTRWAETAERDQHCAMLCHALSQLGSRKPINGTRLSGDAIEACATRITAALERLKRMATDPAAKPSSIQPVVDELRIDLADWLESFKETDACI